jgi:uncharacterized protein RhaS with RHS repeats
LPIGRKQYNYFRDYDPSLGRYVESDPIGLDGGLNIFGYVKSKPLTRLDRYGLFASGIHSELAWNAVHKVCPSMTNDVVTWTVKADFVAGSQDPDNSFMHAMRGPGQSTRDAVEQWGAFIDRSLSKCSAEGLGFALHAAQDFYAKGHSGFQVWDGHITLSHIWNDLYPGSEELDLAGRRSDDIVKDFQRRCPCVCH